MSDPEAFYSFDVGYAIKLITPAVPRYSSVSYEGSNGAMEDYMETDPEGEWCRWEDVVNFLNLMVKQKYPTNIRKG